MGTVSPWMSVPSACLSAHFGWLLLSVTDLLVGKGLKILRSHSLAKGGIEQLGVRPCFQEDAVDARATSWLADTNCPSLPRHRLEELQLLLQSILPSVAHAGTLVHVCTTLTPGVMEGLRLEKTSSIIKSVPQPFVFFFPPLVLASSFSSESVFLEGSTHAVVKIRSPSLGWVLFVLVVNKKWWRDKQLPQSSQSV